jgi:hypothetical protein
MDGQPDSWHIHTAEEGLPQEEHGSHANAAALVGAFVVSVVFVGAVILVVLLYYNTHTTALRQARIETTALSQDYVDYRDRSDRFLSGYGWATPDAAAAGKVSIPIELAMQKVMQQYAGNTGGNR